MDRASISTHVPVAHLQPEHTVLPIKTHKQNFEADSPPGNPLPLEWIGLFHDRFCLQYTLNLSTFSLHQHPQAL